MNEERVQKLMAAAGVDSRRRCEELIREGRVSVNGVIVGIGASATADDDIRVDGKSITQEKPVYFMLNKPVGVTSTRADPHAKVTVVDIVKVPQRIFPIGRLDRETEGLIILSNDGALMQRLTHPSMGVSKSYIVTVDRPIQKAECARLQRGIIIEGRRVEVSNIRMHSENTVQITIHEGRKHIVRRLIQSLGHRVARLVRVSVGPLELGNLPSGKWRPLTNAEIKALKSQKAME